ncbi:hypothetical protein I3760_05G222100 [Carya illinoinensis]|uniref:Uncharacterized protein n=1 Tax=Carya illinoinensis TaxID=32201 RepID=A0A922F7I5_CARIL|nr:hypothetical protein I3760_05G222100 [Carya illinoinensis]KAG6714780.1 hypothetical protein I3842_05G219100 [Carya illinoinensis]
MEYYYRYSVVVGLKHINFLSAYKWTQKSISIALCHWGIMDSNCIAIALCHCGRVQALNHGRRLHSDLIKTGVLNNVFLAKNLIAMYVDSCHLNVNVDIRYYIIPCYRIYSIVILTTYRC